MITRFVSPAMKLFLGLAALLIPTLSLAQVTVVDMIPNSLSNESNRDSEPSVAVNPSDPMEIVASAFTPDPLGSGNGPIYVSTDGGNTWDLNVVLPGGNRTVDISLRYGTLTNTVYAGILRLDNTNLNILRKVNITSPGLMTILINRANDDQPWVESRTRITQDRVYVSSNDLAIFPGLTATVDQSMDAATAPAPAGFATQRINPRSNCGQDGPTVRTAVHPDGTIYAFYFRWTTCSSSPYTSDIVVARDDNWASGATPYTNLVDTGDGFAGVRVVTGVSIPWGSQLGTQRIGSQAAIAVDPRDSDIVYIAWADGTATNYTIHVRRSTDRGVNWSGDLRTASPATNPGLAINTDGRVGFFYQQLTGSAPNQRWETHFEYTDDAFATAPTDLILADVPDQNGSYLGSNPIGDYANVIALAKNFYGVFSANNTPNNANFPNGVSYQRNANFSTNTLLALDNVTPVPASIDPFFFSVRVNQPPVANAGLDQTVECTSPTGTQVTLDGSASSDPDGDALTYSWTGPFPEGGGTVTGVNPMVTLPLGTHTITLTVTDTNGASDTDTVLITVEDTTAPNIGAVTASPNVLWPPNHKMVPVSVAVSVSDICDASPVCQIISVSSNEPVDGLGEGDTAPDWEITGNLTLNLRAERSGTGTGRVYTITIQCTDASDKSSTETVTVQVPHDQR